MYAYNTCYFHPPDKDTKTDVHVNTYQHVTHQSRQVAKTHHFYAPVARQGTRYTWGIHLNITGQAFQHHRYALPHFVGICSKHTDKYMVAIPANTDG